MFNMKLKLMLAGVAGSIGMVLATSFAGATTLSSSTLGAAIDTMNGTVYDYFLVLLASYWPFVVGLAVLIAVWHFGRRAVSAFN